MSVLNEFSDSIVPSLPLINKNLVIALGNKQKTKQKKTAIEFSMETSTSLDFVNLCQIFLDWL